MCQSFIKLAFEIYLIKILIYSGKQIQMHVPQIGTLYFIFNYSKTNSGINFYEYTTLQQFTQNKFKTENYTQRVNTEKISSQFYTGNPVFY